MQQALADFRIESDQVVYLAFADGRSYRVSPGDLEQFLRQDDLKRVRRALRLRGQFLRRILPPITVIVVIVGIIGLGSYDMSRISHSWYAPTSAHSQAYVQKAATTSTTAASPPTTSAAGATPTPQASGSSTGTSARLAPASASTASPAHGGTSAHQQKPASTPPDLQSVKRDPIEAQGIRKVLAPVTMPVGGAVKQLTNLLP